MHIMKVVMKYPPNSDLLFTETITLDYWDGERVLWIVVHSNFILKRFPWICFKGIYQMSKGNNKCNNRRGTQMNVYIPKKQQPLPMSDLLLEKRLIFFKNTQWRQYVGATFVKWLNKLDKLYLLAIKAALLTRRSI